jgi:NAD(P)-dependent dehydrogenase (short-subunit alcohol dehydrogenase family)
MAGASAEQIAAQIRQELTAEPFSAVAAYRNGERYLPSWEQVRLDDEENTPLLRDQGVYLITGAFGGIGLTVAERIAGGRHAKLVLVGRSPLPERSAWPEWLEQHDDGDPTSERIRAVQQIESAGAEVMLACADVADRGQMTAVVDEARRRFGAINGVIHSAGVAGGGIIQLKSQNVADSVLAPKVLGTLVLDELMKDEPLDFFFICSSLASVYGGFGQMDYCAANNFLDAYAQANTQEGRLTVSVNWDTWRDVGMAVKTVVPAELEQSRRESLERGISPSEGADAFIRILNSGRRQVAVCTTDLQANLESGGGLTTDKIELEPSSVSAPRTTHPRPSLATAYAPPRSQTEDEVAAVWQDLLGVAPVGIHDNFFELGGHSLLAIQLISQLRGLFELEVSIQNLFDAPTVAKLAERIDASREESEDMEAVERLLQQVEQLSESEVRSLLDDGRSSTGPERSDDTANGRRMGHSA